jgi:predicted aconitase
MRIVAATAEMARAERLIDVVSAHVDGCLYHGRASLDFAERLMEGGARVRVPTTLNVGSLDLLHPERYRGDPETGRRARRLMDLYEAMGCRPTWTCAPYQLPAHRPARGEHVAWAESNAIVFANSVLGARTDRYGDFIDISAAITGRVPHAGLHRDGDRRGRIVFRVGDVPEALLGEDVFYPVLGYLIGVEAGSRVPVIEGLPPTATEDQLKALGATAASSGSVALFHGVGLTPEAPTLTAALGGLRPERTVDVGIGEVTRARDALTTARGGTLTAVSVGTPHFSVTEFERLLGMLEGRPVAAGVDFYASTSRGILGEVEAWGWLPALEDAGVKVVVDTCTYVTPILRQQGLVMTNSGKWAYYAPGNLGIEVAFGSLLECVRSAQRGEVWRDPELWSDLQG